MGDLLEDAYYEGFEDGEEHEARQRRGEEVRSSYDQWLHSNACALMLSEAERAEQQPDVADLAAQRALSSRGLTHEQQSACRRFIAKLFEERGDWDEVGLQHWGTETGVIVPHDGLAGTYRLAPWVEEAAR